ncbi:MAG: MEKHLA domain-containing protein [Nitrospira sp.]|jgi:MEKHLA domain
MVEWSHRLLESYHYWIGQDLIDRAGDRKAQALRLFEVSIVVVSHGVEPDPILNYGNQAALDLWELPWEQFIQTPSRLTAEADDRTERRRMLERATLTGYFDGYRGVRISSTRRRFLVEQAVIWNVIDLAGHRIGQAAAFSQWSYL